MTGMCSCQLFTSIATYTASLHNDELIFQTSKDRILFFSWKNIMVIDSKKANRVYIRRERLINSLIYFRNSKEIKTTFRGLKNDAKTCDWRPIESPLATNYTKLSFVLTSAEFSCRFIAPGSASLRFFARFRKFGRTLVPTHQIDYYMLYVHVA